MATQKHPLEFVVSQEPRLPVWLTHIWQRRFDHDRLGLVLGAGVSRDAGVPMWEELVKRLTAAAKMPPRRMALHKKARYPETFLAEILYRKHCSDEKDKKSNSDIKPEHKDYHINATWREKIRSCLYRDLRKSKLSDISAAHTYLMPLAKLICNARFAVTFNFDDIVDEAVIACAKEGRLAKPEIIYRPKIETRKNAPVIYHINGSLPRDSLRKSSENVVLTEDAFADILLSPNSQDAEFVINQFAVRTFVLIGVSLSDNSLKNLLRASAKRNPANHHFIIFHEREREPRTVEERKDLFDVNLNVYNLISIFLKTSEIKAFIEIINEENGDSFDKSLGALVGSKIDRKYYLVGSIAAGKSSTLDNLRCFTTHEEFSGRVPAAMYQDDKTLTTKQQKEVDDYLFPQLIEKNFNMIRMNAGIRIMDRAYLDLFAFSNGNRVEIKRKASELKKRLKAWGKPLEEGHVFFLKASECALEERLARRGARKRVRGKTSYGTDTLLKQEAELLKIYGPLDATIDTSNSTIGDTAKYIARVILLEDYRPFDFAARLDQVIKNKGRL
jgi:hypothetical protein